MSEPEPPPRENTGRPVWDLVVEDMRERDRVGRERYGTSLQAHNGRRPLVDAYQEVLDLAVYLRQEIAEREDGSEGAPGADAVARAETSDALLAQAERDLAAARDALPEHHGYERMTLPDAIRELARDREELGARVREKADWVVALERERARLAVEKEHVRTAWELASKRAKNVEASLAKVERERARAESEITRARAELPDHESFRAGSLDEGIRRLVKAETWGLGRLKEARERSKKLAGEIAEARAVLIDLLGFRPGTLAEGIRRCVKVVAARNKARPSDQDLRELLGEPGTLPCDALHALARAALAGNIPAESEHSSDALWCAMRTIAGDVVSFPRQAAILAVLALRAEKVAEIRARKDTPRCGTCKACHRTDASSGAAIWVCLRLAAREIGGPDALPLSDCPGHVPSAEALGCLRSVA